MLRTRILRQAGVTLAEMLVVVAIVALTARIAIPSADPLTAVRNDVATSEVLNAIRFAQREAIRTGAYYIVKIDTGTQTLRVYRATVSGAEDTTFTVLHPIDKRKYELAFNSDPARATLSFVDFDYNNGNTNLNTLSFGPDGTPALRTGPKNGDVMAMTLGRVNVASGSQTRNLTIDILTGRVSG